MPSSSLEQAATYPTVGLMRRLAALFYDSLIVLALWWLVAGIAVVLNGNEAITDSRWLLYLSLIAINFLFFTKFWLDGGQTIGMRAWRVRLASLDGNSVTFMQCVLRFVGAMLSFASLGLGYLWILADRERLAWHDRYSGTRLVVLPKLKKHAD